MIINDFFILRLTASSHFKCCIYGTPFGAYIIVINPYYSPLSLLCLTLLSSNARYKIHCEGHILSLVYYIEHEVAIEVIEGKTDTNDIHIVEFTLNNGP